MKNLKPGQVCQIRGMPQNHPGYPFLGKIVTIQNIRYTLPEHGAVWSIEPHLQATVEGRSWRVEGCAERWLYPLDDFDFDGELLDLTLEHTFQQQLAKSLGL